MRVVRRYSAQPDQRVHLRDLLFERRQLVTHWLPQKTRSPEDGLQAKHNEQKSGDEDTRHHTVTAVRSPRS